jgi:hypothetical protein
MFSTPRNSVIESDRGFSVEVLGRTGLRYVEGERSLHIDSEVLAGPSGVAVYSASIRNWSPPNTDEPIDGETKARIIENLRAAFRLRGFEIDVF